MTKAPAELDKLEEAVCQPGTIDYFGRLHDNVGGLINWASMGASSA